MNNVKKLPVNNINFVSFDKLFIDDKQIKLFIVIKIIKYPFTNNEFFIKKFSPSGKHATMPNITSDQRSITIQHVAK